MNGVVLTPIWVKVTNGVAAKQKALRLKVTYGVSAKQTPLRLRVANYVMANGNEQRYG